MSIDLRPHLAIARPAGLVGREGHTLLIAERSSRAAAQGKAGELHDELWDIACAPSDLIWQVAKIYDSIVGLHGAPNAHDIAEELAEVLVHSIREGRESPEGSDGA